MQASQLAATAAAAAAAAAAAEPAMTHLHTACGCLSGWSLASFV